MENQGQEIFIGLVGPLGTDLECVYKAVESSLREINYEAKLVRLSEILQHSDVWEEPANEYYDSYISSHQKMGDLFRERAKREDALAIAGVAAIQEKRNPEGCTPDEQQPQWRTAYVIRSLKLPQEIDRLRSIYGDNFYVVSAYAPRTHRVNKVAELIAQSHHHPTKAQEYRSQAEQLILIDESEKKVNSFGQNVEDAFPLGDFFIDTSDKTKVHKDVERIVEMLFGHPYHTPTRDEYAMFHAKAAALRSSDLSRQVGASIVNEDGDVLSVGTNEVPKVGGGLYWADGDCDHRDFTLDVDTSTELKREALTEVIAKLHEGGYIDKAKEREVISAQSDSVKSLEGLMEKILPMMKQTQVMNVGEFGRTVHAEMAALMDAARRGVPVKNMKLYTTTFPCHNCAKHIIAAGIDKVVYVEPYPKSLATSLHSDEIDHDSGGKNQLKFEPFVGVAPRMYMELFEITRRKSKDGKMLDWDEIKNNANPRLPELNAHLGYIRKEYEALDELAG